MSEPETNQAPAPIDTEEGKEALGGSAVKMPTTFRTQPTHHGSGPGQGIGRPGKNEPTIERASNPIFDDPSPQVIEARKSIGIARLGLKTLAEAIDSAARLRPVLDYLANDEVGKAEAARMDFATKDATKFLDQVEGALDKLKPKTD